VRIAELSTPVVEVAIKVINASLTHKKAELSQRRPRDAPYVWAP